MRISHSDAISLEATVRRVFSCDRAGMGGYIDANHFESQPFDAALIALAPLWQKGGVHEIEDFLYKWELVLRDEAPGNFDASEYIDQLDGLITTLMER